MTSASRGLRQSSAARHHKLRAAIYVQPHSLHAAYQVAAWPALPCRGRLHLQRCSAAPSSSGQQRQRPDPLPRDDDGPSTSGSSHDLNVPEGPAEPQQPRTPWLVLFLQRLKAPQWLVAFVGTYVVPPPNARTAPLARALWITIGFLSVALGRELLFPTPRVVAREVMYSDFVTLLDAGRVRAARLEAGSSKLYFDIRMPLSQPSMAAAVSTTVAAASAAAGVTATAATAPAMAAPVAVAATQVAPVAVAATPAAGAEYTAADSTSASSSSAEGSSGNAPTAASSSSTAAAATSAPVRQRFQKQFFIKLADKHDPVLVTRLLQAGVEFAVLRTTFQATLANAFLTTLALWLPLLPMIFLLRRIIDQRQGTGRAKKASTPGNTPSTTFADVAGVDAAKAELLEVVTVMRQSKAAYSKLKVKMPSGVLLCGPPGTGKTLLAKAVAGEAGVPFFAVSASEFVELFVGRGAARIRELFAEARKAAPCVVFVDELDGVGSRRGMGYNDERDQTLNQLLTELDGFDGRPGVLFLAATNRIDVLDPALLRPGRISRKVVVPLPDAPGRAQILAVHLRGVPLEQGLEPETCCQGVAAATEGFSGAELANVVNEATLLAARESRDSVNLRDLLAGAQRTRFGVNGRSGANGFGGALTQRLQTWLMDAAAQAADRRPVKVTTGSG